MDTADYQPSLRPRDSPYESLIVYYDDGEMSLRQGVLVAGAILNHAFSQPYFLPDSVYLILDGRVMLMPETES